MSYSKSITASFDQGVHARLQNKTHVKTASLQGNLLGKKTAETPKSSTTKPLNSYTRYSDLLGTGVRGVKIDRENSKSRQNDSSLGPQKSSMNNYSMQLRMAEEKKRGLSHSRQNSTQSEHSSKKKKNASECVQNVYNLQQKPIEGVFQPQIRPRNRYFDTPKAMSSVGNSLLLKQSYDILQIKNGKSSGEVSKMAPGTLTTTQSDYENIIKELRTSQTSKNGMKSDLKLENSGISANILSGYKAVSGPKSTKNPGEKAEIRPNSNEPGFSVTISNPPGIIYQPHSRPFTTQATISRPFFSSGDVSALELNSKAKKDKPSRSQDKPQENVKGPRDNLQDQKNPLMSTLKPHPPSTSSGFKTKLKSSDSPKKRKPLILNEYGTNEAQPLREDVSDKISGTFSTKSKETEAKPKKNNFFDKTPPKSEFFSAYRNQKQEKSKSDQNQENSLKEKPKEQEGVLGSKSLNDQNGKEKSCESDKNTPKNPTMNQFVTQVPQTSTSITS